MADVRVEYEERDRFLVRIGRHRLVVDQPVELTPARRAGLLRVVEHCTLHKSLRQPPGVNTWVVARETVAA